MTEKNKNTKTKENDNVITEEENQELLDEFYLDKEHKHMQMDKIEVKLMEEYKHNFI